MTTRRGWWHNSQVYEDLPRIVGNVHVREQREERANGERVDGNAALVRVAEEPRCLPVFGKAVDSTSGDIKVRVGSREDENEDATVQEAGEELDPCKLNGDDERRGGGLAPLLVGENQVFRVVRHVHAEEQDAKDVEKQDPIKGQFDRSWDRLARILRLSHGHTDELGTGANRKASAPRSIPNSISS